MAVILQSPFLRLRYDPPSGAWSIASAEEDSTALRSARIGVGFRAGRKRVRWILDGSTTVPKTAIRTSRLHGRFRVLSVDAEAGYGLAVRLQWRLSL